MTHIAQQSGRLPQSMMLDGVEIYINNKARKAEPVAGGSFADVWRGLHKSDGKVSVVAIKQLRLLGNGDNMRKRTQVRRYILTQGDIVLWLIYHVQQMFLEILTCRTLRHPNILTICGVPKSFTTPAVVTPCLDNGTILEHLGTVNSKYTTTPLWQIGRAHV